MAKKTCSDCAHCDVCENTFSWLGQEDNTKYITCHHFKNKADVVEVVRCKDCVHSRPLCFTEKKLYNDDCVGCIKISTSYHSLIMNENDFCSYGEKRREEE